MLEEEMNDAGFSDEEMSNIVYLNDEDGNQVAFEYLDLIEYKGERYVVLLPTEDDDADEVVVLRLEEGENEENFYSVEDEKVLEAVFEIFREKFKEEFQFE